MSRLGCPTRRPATARLPLLHVNRLGQLALAAIAPGSRMAMPRVQAHIVLDGPDGIAIGARLREAYLGPMLEVARHALVRAAPDGRGDRLPRPLEA